MGLTDTIMFTCPACAHKAEFPRAQEGKAIYCPKCGSAQVVRQTDRFERIPTGQIRRAETDAAGTGTFSANGRIDFSCASCGHAARIAASLAGQPVRCPNCSMVQLAGVGAVKSVRLDQNGKLPFTCSACSFIARLSPEYAGKAIRCPKCQAAQVVPRVAQEGDAARVGTGQVARPATGQIARPATGQIRRSATGAIPRTPAGGTPAPLAMPTPRPGTLVTPPPMPAPTPAYPTPQPGSLAVAPATAPIEPKTPPPVAEEGLPPIIRTPLPAPVDATAIPTPPPASQHETTEELFSAERAAPAPAKPAVVRRRGQSGRMQLPAGEGPRPAPSAEPTVEPARAIDYVAPEGRSEAGSEPRPRPAWMQHAAIAAGVVVLIACIACAFLWRGASADADRLQRSLRDAQAKAEGLEKEVAGLQGRLNESEARSRDIEAKGKLLESERDRLAEEAKRLRDEIDQLKKQPAAAEAKPSAQPAAK